MVEIGESELLKRVDELKMQNKHLMSELRKSREFAKNHGRCDGTYLARAVDAEAKLAVAVEALEFYADPEHWTIQWVEGSHGDYGKRARQALKEADDG